MQGSSILPPGGQFPTSSTSDNSLLAFRCAPIFKPYLEEDVTASVIIDAPVTYTQISGAQPITLSDNSHTLDVVISVGDTHLADASVPLNASKFEIPFPLHNLTAQKAAYNISCTATYSKTQVFSTSAKLLYLPDPPMGGSVTKMDLRTGALLNKAVGEKSYTPVFSLGFYTNFGGYLAANLSILDDLKERGYVCRYHQPILAHLNFFNSINIVCRPIQVAYYKLDDISRYTRYLLLITLPP
jgi:hypothetical protein